ncbi:MAG: DUF1902 domain-containing protein [Spirochaetaceae bacterium]|nr:DUF1902 domain-containing protein [Spirochaetaceae bacterium]
MDFTIKIDWDEETNGWYAINDELPVATESNSYDALIEKVKVMAYEMLEDNHNGAKAKLHFVSERTETLR